MDFNQKLIELRKMKGWSQEELGFRLDVSRQTVSKWESGDTSPEMARLVKMSDIFEISLDELMKGEVFEKEENIGGLDGGSFVIRAGRRVGYEYASKIRIGNVPLLHINLGRGAKIARGVIAIGNISVGLVSIGLFSIGILSFGLIGLGGLSVACIAFGGLALGGIAFGVVAAGGLALGWLAAGGVAIGIYSFGGCAVARDIAMGGYAEGYIAVGEQVKGVVEFTTGPNFYDFNKREFLQAAEDSFPEMNRFVSGLLKSLVQ
ncbi:MAG: helix-turn-helix transcriptional regulator [Spirochaetales bacterium]|nr:helix-turn-helix transcriptional regulator [Spirochaetales bacterium]